MNNTGIFLLIGGWISLTSWGIFQGVTESDSPVLTISLAAVWLGILILLILDHRKVPLIKSIDKITWDFLFVSVHA